MGTIPTEKSERSSLAESRAAFALLDRRGKLIHCDDRFKALRRKIGAPLMRFARAEPDGAPSTREIADESGARYLVESNRIANGDTIVLCHNAGFAGADVSRETILKQAAHMAGLGYWVWDVDSDRCALCNDAFTALFSADADACQRGDLSLATRARRVHPEDLDRYLDATRKALGDGAPYDIEYRVVKPDGKIRDCREMVDAMTDPAGRVTHLVASIQDITHLRHGARSNTGPDAENARFLALAKFAMDNANDAVFWLGPDGSFEYVNWAGCRMLGYELDELRGMSIADIDRDVSREKWSETWRRVRRNAPYTFDATHHTKDGRPIPVEISIFSVDFEDRELICVFSRDITERKQTEALLETQRAQAERSSRLKTEFLARMSHELKTPLNAIIGFAEIIKDGHLGSEGIARHTEFGENILVSARHLHDLIKDVLDLTQIEMGAETLDPQYLDVTVLTETARTIVQTMATDTGIEIAVDHELPLPELFADQRRMLQILVNLLSNGIKHTPAGGDVRLIVRHSRDGGWSFAVADRGPGIEPGDIPAALSIFGRLRKAKTDQDDDGVGLGLPIVKALVERHAGSLEFEPRDGGGMVVTAHIPDRRSKPAGLD